MKRYEIQKVSEEVQPWEVHEYPFSHDGVSFLECFDTEQEALDFVEWQQRLDREQNERF